MREKNVRVIVMAYSKDEIKLIMKSMKLDFALEKMNADQHQP